MKVTILVHSINKFDQDYTLVEALKYEDNMASDPETAAENAFHLTNAPEEHLDENFRTILEKSNYHRNFPSMSSGDFVKIESEGETFCFLCKSIGWEEIDPTLVAPGSIVSREDRWKIV